MDLMINSYNTVGAGTANMSQVVLESLFQKENKKSVVVVLPKIDRFKNLKKYNSRDTKVILLPYFPNVFNILFRGMYDFFLFPLMTLFYRPKRVLVMGNYAPMLVFGKKAVIMRHTYLVDSSLKKYLSLFGKTIELLRSLVFRLTLKSTKMLIVQSGYMRDMIVDRLPYKREHIKILPNPMMFQADSSEGVLEEDSEQEGVKPILYVSRFYPHKNHSFIVKIAKAHQEQMRANKMVFQLTLNDQTVDAEYNKGVRQLMQEVQDEGLSDLVINLGELPQSDLKVRYQKARCLFFPSETESFGNPLVEAMTMELPVVAPELLYAKTVCEEAAVFYQLNQVDDAFKALEKVCMDDAFHDERAKMSKEQAKKFPNIEQWWEQIFTWFNA